MNVRRLAAVDMYGTVGARWRRRIVVAEFIVGAVGGVGPGLWIMLSSRSLGWQVSGAWLVGMGVNYLLLAGHAVSLSRPGALNTELAGVDVRAELRYYGLAQLWLAIPLAVALLALLQLRRPPRRVEPGTVPRERHD
ncbi:hypothetical protein MRQ36_29560 [Micromonospora sp. R77]|uniref:hypothetical protein n=1 Tax=Micromonospora sp. R77 TaxID=2925836 RepID=UPI001F605588|nr:hypothetical protein [Micromonospora sp. R77]MCI4066481.1 hypothetical protein [Micromonospora sp. R77]